MIEQVASRFGLGELIAEPARVTGGLSNELWRVTTAGGVFAVKRMVTGADRPDFAANVEAAFAVERRAWAAGVPMPAPVPAGGRALAELGGALFRVHRWADGVPGAGSAAEAIALLAAVHAAGDPRETAPPEAGWQAGRWGAALTRLVRRTGPGPSRMLVVDSHRDLDRKNTLRTPGGTLLAVDWDAAGPIGAVHEAVGLALDWSGGDPAVFADTLHAYGPVPAEPWIFAAWIAAQGGWLDHQATLPSGEPEVTTTLTRLHNLAAELDTLLTAI